MLTLLVRPGVQARYAHDRVPDVTVIEPVLGG